MINTYFKIAWRNLSRHKLFSLINIISLAIGFSASFVIGMMVYFDLTFDAFHKDTQLIYRITTEFVTPEGEFYNPGVPAPMAAEVRDKMSGVDKVTSLYIANFNKIENPESQKVFKEPEYVGYTQSEYFDIFQYQWLAGNKHTVLQQPNELVLSEARAKKYFPDESPNTIIGKTLVYNDSVAVSIVGVVANFSQRSDLIFEEFISRETARQAEGVNSSVLSDSWDNTNSASQVFMKLRPGTSESSITSQLELMAQSHASESQKRYKQKRLFSIQNLADLHFSENMGVFDFSAMPASKQKLWGLGAIALFLLLLGCINFINLTTAQSNQRSKEIGIRKTLGSSKKQIIWQFLGETFLLTLISALVSVVLAYYLLHVFSDFTPKGLSFSLFAEPVIIAFSVLLVIMVTLLAGIYPSMVLTHFKPVSVLKNQVIVSNNKPNLRRFLTVFQFSIAQVFIVSTLLVGKQIKFMMTQDMGIDTEAIAYVQTPWDHNSIDKVARLGRSYEGMPQINAISLGSYPPASFSTNSNMTTYIKDEIEIQTPLEMLFGDVNYMKLYGMDLLAGRDRLNDTIKELVVNEAYLKTLGIETPQDAIAKQVTQGDQDFTIVGVVKNFNQRSLKSNIEPMALTGDLYRGEFNRFKTIHLKLNASEGEALSKTIAGLEMAYKEVYPESDFKLNFMDDTVASFYRQEKSFSKLLNWAMGLSVLISCLGLLGLVIYTTERRTKEIGIRKVLGANLAQLNALLCKEFLLLVGIACVIAAPIAWWGMSNWLQDFAFKTNLSWWIFLISGLGMIVLALLIMSIKTIATAMKNPVNSLRTE